MSIKIHGDVKGKRVTRKCPVCDGDMVPITQDGKPRFWQCANDDCAHQEED
jgi:ssDNA-binding Zn-finger/Zn-ribbon topoisomerase 1